MKKIPFSINMVSQHIDEMANGVKHQLINILQHSEFSIQVDESIVVDNQYLMMVYVRYFSEDLQPLTSLEEDRRREGRPSKLDEDILKAKTEENSNITTEELAEELKVSKSTTHEHLVKLGYISCYNVWVPHKLSEKNCLDRYSVCGVLLKQNESMPVLKQLVTEDEKWTVYECMVWKRVSQNNNQR
ncbi:histone-lysine N-methyltransferase SETMAR-like [Octopus sinensis]|uniref:Histone-lysine N-methyltransferase SETMAR-like n=1 Tax=Octopus sinensis TaxID=2607531 RepID=A0A7E6FS97_9MOLL|nr:histone-lysine N-methyltransferase SETMAR-like [Octopus sinensis]